VLSGACSADFLNAIDLSKAMSRPMKLPISNGRQHPDLRRHRRLEHLRRDGARLPQDRSPGLPVQLCCDGDGLVEAEPAFFQAPGYPAFYSWVGDLVFIITTGQTVAGAKHIPAATTLRRDCQSVAAAVARAAARR
jgi:hypothetical protein